MDQWLDWPAFGFLALLTLLDGLRRVPAGALVLRRILGGEWQVVEPRPGYRLVSWWPPLTVSIVVPLPTGPAAGEPLDRRLETLRTAHLVLNLVGLVSLGALVIIVPLAMRWWGGVGFLLALLSVLLLSVSLTALSYRASRPLGLTTKERLWFALPRLNPFAAPAAGEALLERAVQGTEPLAVARALMTEEGFEGWIRPLAYDVVQGLEGDRGAELLRVVGRILLENLANRRPAMVAATSPWCPRCGSEFGAAQTVCARCEVRLRIDRSEGMEGIAEIE